MPMPIFDPIRRKIQEAEGYLELQLPRNVLEVLQSRSDWASMQFEASFLTGEALRQMGRYRDALEPLENAAALRPSHLGVAISLGWCYKRTHRLAQAIDALERVERFHPEEGLIRYNLACYWSLASSPSRAIEKLAQALALEPWRRQHIADETDFDPIRHLPEFDRLVSSGRTSHT